MPLYTVQCQVCEKQGTQKLTFAEYDEVKAQKRDVSCPHCGGWANIVFDPGNVNFVLKDGESGGWISKAGRENTFRRRHNVEVSRRQRDHAPRTTLQPNFQGGLTGTWKTAQEAAFETRYDEVKQEHGAQVAVQAATEAARTYDPLVNRQVTR
jgi:hypothetical protein